MEAPWSVALIVPDRKARLLLESSQARPPSSWASFQNAVKNFTDSIVYFELRLTVLASASTSRPPHATKWGEATAGASPRLRAGLCPRGRSLALSFLPASRYSSQVSGNLVTPI